MASAVQVAERFGLGRAVTYARLGGLVHVGLLKHARIFHGVPGVYLATRVGLMVVNLNLPSAREDLRTYDHDLELTSLVEKLEREFGPESVITEREMRAETTPGVPSKGRPRFGIPLTGARGQLELTPLGYPRLHFPDCAVTETPSESTNGVLAIELERTPKGRARLRRILQGYIAARHVRGVRYYAVGDRARPGRKRGRLAAG